MPQFDTLSFFNQVFWLFLIIFSFYIVVLRFLLPTLAFSLKSRTKVLKLTSGTKPTV
uniref:ATPase subunit 8 n=1 Tax=Scytothamnus australis TaxID=66621 RepID=UPI002E7A1848|nr:ATPase subunit 8 [Scytothamnus australis]WBP70318.1 ATPase subunit 8 [Scytothamnus australis]